jgi:hypothetical protein
MNDPAEVEGVAEGLWQMAHGVDIQAVTNHERWLDIPEPEKEAWRVQAREAISNWSKFACWD